ncbi:putative polysaccharide biosynthesis protein [Lentilactobacillus laojiaonis]|uniref:putative polysaccharide biosynthesis protein n=1 Tax=Lentilactobacillus laojiaonis TaxID=2883998 RepID=UPI001D0B7EE3|nr:polysaccharide biosynthesis protein [Lentilactobacillus laojiaonis]UDM32540.1 polysaccharide biosynthesis protein [Lentilactobacillus laojiaonis]
MEDETKSNTNSSSKSQMLSGSAWMTAGSIFSRFLGAIYIIPWSIWFGSYFLRGNALYGFGYNIYSFFLIAAIAGIPSAIAKQVAHYNALNEYGVGVRLYKRGLVLAAATGIICALILYFGAPWLDGGNDKVIPVLHSLSWAILIIPTMSLTRGYFQGYQQMAPSAISQFVEQLARVIYMLVTAYLIMQVFHGSWITAVAQSTFAAFIGAVAGLLILGVYYLRRKNYFNSLVANSNNEIHVEPKELYREIIVQAVPFIILGAGITIFQLIDQYTFFNIMHQATNYSNTILNDLYAMFAVNANKLIMITISLASALAITAVPLLSVAITKGDKHEVKEQNSNVLMLFMFVMIPAALGMAAIAGPLNRLFYGNAQQALGANILSFSSIVSVPMGLFVVTSAVMQGLSQNKKAVRYFIIGTIVKLIAQWPCVYFLGAFGALLATAIGLIVANGLIIISLNRQFGFDRKALSNGFAKITTYSAIMYIVALALVYFGNFVLGLFTNPYSRIGSLIVTAVAVIIAGYLYLYLVLKGRVADSIIGPRSQSLRKKLHIK